MNFKSLIYFFLINLKFSESIFIFLNCQSSICQSNKIFNEKIDKNFQFIVKNNKSEIINELHLSWLTNGVQNVDLSDFINLKILKIKNSNLENSTKFLESLKNIKTLQISENQMKTFPNFNGNLSKVFIAKNKIEMVKKSNFKNVENLTAINLEENQIFYINQNAFCGNTKLKFLNLNKNFLTEIDFLKFSTNLKELYLNFNRISKITKETFSSNKFIEILELRGNKIEEIHKKFFIKNIHLRWLDLAENEIFYIQTTAFERITFIDLTFNLCINEGFYTKSKLIKHVGKLIERNCHYFFMADCGLI